MLYGKIFYYQRGLEYLFCLNCQFIGIFSQNILAHHFDKNALFQENR